MRDDGALRGASPEREPWSVWRVGCGAPPQPAVAPMTAGVRRIAEEGNVVGMRFKKRMPPSREAFRISRSGQDASFARSSDPYASIAAATSWAQAHGGSALASASRSGKPASSGRNRHRGRIERTSCGSPRVTASARKYRVTRQKRKEVTASVPARIASSGLSPVHRFGCCRSRKATSGPK